MGYRDASHLVNALDQILTHGRTQSGHQTFKETLTNILAHISLGRKKDPSYINMKNPNPQEVQRIPNIDPEYLCLRNRHYKSIILQPNLR